MKEYKCLICGEIITEGNITSYEGVKNCPYCGSPAIHIIKDDKPELVKSERTPAQEQRQRFRENGKYAKVNPCYVCGKSAGVNYHSHPDTDDLINDELLCLCSECYQKLSKYDGKTAIKMAFGEKMCSDCGQNGHQKGDKDCKWYLKPEKLDAYWVKDKDLICPFCGSKKIFYDTHDDKEATHYCKNCRKSMLIVDSVDLREGEEE